MPEYYYDKEPIQEWLCNIANPLILQELIDFIQGKVDQRKQELTKNHNLEIKIKHEFEDLLVK